MKANLGAGELEDAFASFLHYSDSLMHFDMSGIEMSIEGYFHVAERGIRKSRTLLSIHMGGMPLRQDELQELRQSLKVKETFSA